MHWWFCFIGQFSNFVGYEIISWHSFIVYWSFFRWGAHLYMSLFLSVCLSVCASICVSVCCVPYLRNRISSNHNFWYTCVKWWYLKVFFLYFEILIFWAVRKGKKRGGGVKGEKNSPKWKIRITCVTHHISETV